METEQVASDAAKPYPDNICQRKSATFYGTLKMKQSPFFSAVFVNRFILGKQALRMQASSGTLSSWNQTHSYALPSSFAGYCKSVCVRPCVRAPLPTQTSQHIFVDFVVIEARRVGNLVFALNESHSMCCVYQSTKYRRPKCERVLFNSL